MNINHHDPCKNCPHTHCNDCELNNNTQTVDYIRALATLHAMRHLPPNTPQDKITATTKCIYSHFTGRKHEN